MFVQRMKIKIYNHLVNTNPTIFEKYKAYRKGKVGLGRVKSWLVLLRLTLVYRLLKRKNDRGCSSEKESLFRLWSESVQGKRESIAALVEKLSSYDIITFDVFDTLIFRPVNQPSDLFHFVGEKLNYLNFEEIRREAEGKARDWKERNYGNREVTLEEIWQLLEAETGIDKRVGIQAELDIEKRMCFSNPYMKAVLSELQRKGKTLIAISDMYLSKEQITEVLEASGWSEIFEEIFVSSEYGVSKSDGRLYSIVQERFGKEKTYIHVGDNRHSDVKQARKRGIDSYYYPNVNEVGEDYRPREMSPITGGLYKGLVNAYLHSGMKEYSKTYELGFIYGGLFVLGYCRWIHAYAKRERIDKILFLARDGDILHRVYGRLYDGRGESVSSQYVYWSRLAGTKMCARYYKHDYMNRFLYKKINQDYSLEEIFEGMDLAHLLEIFLQENGKYHKDTLLTQSVAEVVKEYLKKKWEEILAVYQEQILAGGKYYQEVLEGCRKVVAVDVGWAGSGAIQLDYLVNQVWKLDCEVIGLIAGTNSKRSDEPDASESLLYTGKLESYLFSQSHNRDLWQTHNPGTGHNLMVEALLASQEKPFRCFTLKGNGLEFGAEYEGKAAMEIQQGILDFVDYYVERVIEIPKISGRDGYAPIKALGHHVELLKKILGESYFKMNVE